MSESTTSQCGDAWYQTLFDANPLPMLVYDTQSFSFLDANRGAMWQYGYSREEWLSMSMQDLCGADAMRSLEEVKAAPETAFHRAGIQRHRRKNGTQIDVDVLQYRIPFQGKAAVLIMLHDMTEQCRMEDRLRQVEHDLKQAQSIAHIGTWVWEIQPDRCKTFSDETYRIFGLDPQRGAISSAALFQRIHPEDRERVRRVRGQVLANPGTRYDIEYRVIHPDGSVWHVHSMAEAAFDDQGTPVRMVGMVQDVTEKKSAEERIRRLAYYDEVTGLPNRVMLQEELSRALASSPGCDRPLALLLVDLDRLGEINNTFGHAIGDGLLKEVGKRLRQEMQADQMVAYIGSAKFAVVLTDAAAYNTSATIRQILNALEAPCPVSGLAYELGVQVGVALAPGHGTDTGTLLRKAHVALVQARQSGLSHALYQASQDPYKPQRLALLGEFRRAVHAGELQLYCQPKADIVSGEIIGAEALVRWQHPERGLILPDQFVPLIEPTDLIHLLTKFMLQAAISQCYSWKQQGFHIPLAVNLSVRNLMEPDLAANLNYFLLTWGADPDWLGLEITESSLMKDPTASIAELDRLSKMGFRLFIDDFGTGYSSLNYLMKLPVNVIKIDHGFTMRMIEDKNAAAIVKSTIDLAHNLGMTVVAEGTCTQAVWNALSTLGCDEAQGHFISPPIPAKDFMPWLHASDFTLRNVRNGGRTGARH